MQEWRQRWPEILKCLKGFHYWIRACAYIFHSIGYQILALGYYLARIKINIIIPAHQIIPVQTISMVFLSNDTEHPLTREIRPRVNFSVNTVYVYSHIGAGIDVNTTRLAKDSQISSLNYVRSNIPDGGLFAFGLGIFIATKYTAIINVDSGVTISNSEFQNALDIVGRGEAEVCFDSDKPSFFAATQAAVRRFTVYTDIKYSERDSLKLFYETCRIQKLATYRILTNSSETTSFIEKLPNSMTCGPSEHTVGSLAFLLPQYKRNYLNLTVSNVLDQDNKPTTILVFQNRGYLTYDFKALKTLTDPLNINLYHIWCTNWVSYYYLTYMGAMFLHESRFMKLDDDFFIGSPKALTSYENLAVAHPKVLFGLRSFIPELWCGRQVSNIRHDPNWKVTPVVGHLGCAVFMPTWAGKILHRFEIYTHTYAEDLSISLSNSFECGFKSWEVEFETTNVSSTDGLASAGDSDFAGHQFKIHDQLMIVYGIYNKYARRGMTAEFLRGSPTCRATASQDINFRMPH